MAAGLLLYVIMLWTRSRVVIIPLIAGDEFDQNVCGHILGFDESEYPDKAQTKSLGFTGYFF